MANLLLISPSDDFAADIKEQFGLYAPDVAVFSEWSEGVVFDAAIVDEDWDKACLLGGKLRNAPIIFLGNDISAERNSIVIIEKPVRLEKLLDAVLSGINLFARSGDAMLVFGGYSLDCAQKEITCIYNGRTVKLTEREVAILCYLYKAHEKTVSKQELLSEVWGYNPDATTHTVETHIYRLRQKIEENGCNEPVIITEEAGYTLNF
uniref:DNA-binding response regulator n=1 Tax=uncultured Alphaproteobacteria bacterium TaxID=91750 RepID=A0A6G8F2Y7_9PROT|nr:DNA-binding response regulator [uncultured Alphaproteobacteria bacterium]